jgi:hypothetical protein
MEFQSSYVIMSLIATLGPVDGELTVLEPTRK